MTKPKNVIISMVFFGVAVRHFGPLLLGIFEVSLFLMLVLKLRIEFIISVNRNFWDDKQQSSKHTSLQLQSVSVYLANSINNVFNFLVY